jgi:hypothetical protein
VTYKNRLILLVSAVTLLGLAYTASYIFSPERGNAMSAQYVWLDKKLAANTDRIVINTESQTVELLKKDSLWLVLHNGFLYPARKTRIEDFTGILTAKSAWPVRSSGSSSHDRFGLDGEKSPRIKIYADNTVLLDLLCGGSDITGCEIYLRKFASNEVRSGENSIASYINGPVNNWFNLALIPESQEGRAGIDSVQRLTVYNNGETQVFTRNNRVWTVSGINVENPDFNSIENYIRTVLNTEGDNFVDSVSSGDPVFNKSRIIFEFGNGKVVTIRLSEPDETNRSFAHVSGSEYVYSIPSWVTARIFRTASDFEKK